MGRDSVVAEIGVNNSLKADVESPWVCGTFLLLQRLRLAMLPGHLETSTRIVHVSLAEAGWDGRLLPFRVGDLPKVMPEVVLRKRPTRAVTMAKAALNNGQTF